MSPCSESNWQRYIGVQSKHKHGLQKLSRLCSAFCVFCKHFFLLCFYTELQVKIPVQLGVLYFCCLLLCTNRNGFVFFFPNEILNRTSSQSRFFLFIEKCACGEVSTNGQNLHKEGRTCRRQSCRSKGLLKSLPLLKSCACRRAPCSINQCLTLWFLPGKWPHNLPSAFVTCMGGKCTEQC